MLPAHKTLAQQSAFWSSFSYSIITIVHFFQRQCARSALCKEAHTAGMLPNVMNEIVYLLFVGTFALLASGNFGNALGADCLWMKMN